MDKEMGKEICVIIPAAGIGTRMNSETPKQFMLLNGKPVIWYTVKAFLNLHWITKVAVVSSAEKMKEMWAIFACFFGDERLAIMQGSNSRHRSILAAFRSLKEEKRNYKLVIIHDGVRPVLDEELLRGVVESAEYYGAAGIACPLTSTMISTDESSILKHVFDRNKMVASEMPQAFRFSVAFNAYSACKEEELDTGTECLKLIQDFLKDKGESKLCIKLLPGSEECWKITYNKDLYSACAILKGKETAGIAFTGLKDCGHNFTVLSDALEKALSSKFEKVEIPLAIFKKDIPNLVFVHQNYTLSEVISISEEQGKTTTSCFCHSSSIVNILFLTKSGQDAIELIQKARRIAQIRKRKNSRTYYIVVDLDKLDSQADEISSMAASLLFDSNENLSGSVFFV